MKRRATAGGAVRWARDRLLGGGGIAVTAAVAALAPLRAVAQDARLDRRLDSPTREMVVRLVDSARVAGLPTEPLVDKALEGASKRASGQRIAQAVRTLAGDLAQSRALLGADASVGEIVAGARALRAGVSPTTLQRFQRERSRRPMTVALVVLGELVASGVPPDTAARTVLALTVNGARDEELVAYQRGVERGAQLGAPPAPRGVLGAGDRATAGSPAGANGLGKPGTSAGPPTPRQPPRKPPRP